MSYSLISTNYIPADYGVQLVQGVKNGRTPRGALGGSNGSFVVKTDNESAKFYFCFEDSSGDKKYYEAYSTIKKNMKTQKLTQKRCYKISQKVAENASKSSKFEPEKWVIKAVQDLKI